MQHVKKYFTEGLIQFAILLSLVGVRVDVDTYLGGYLSRPLLETAVGPSSAYAQTPFHGARDTPGDGCGGLHAKCPDLERYYLASGRRLLREVRALGSPRFLPTRLSAWLVHLAPAEADAVTGTQEDPLSSDGVTGSGGGTEDEDDDRTFLHVAASQSAAPEGGARPCPGGDTSAKEGLHGDGTPPTGVEPQASLGHDVDQCWHDFLSLSGFDDMDLGVDMSSAISQDVSLQDAMVTAGRAGQGGAGVRWVFRAESIAEEEEEGTTRAGFLDEAVFEQINLLGLGLGGVSGAEGGRDSDSGLSLGSGSHSPSSPGSSSDAEPPVAMDADIWAEIVRHDHTYPAPPLREVKREALSEDEEDDEDEEDEEEEEEMSRDERRARALCIPVSAAEVVAMPVEDFLSLVGGRGLSAAQVTLLRDIRRRGKNKMAARSCRRRKLEAIGRLEGEVGRLERERDRLRSERAQSARAHAALARRLHALSRRVLERLCDDRGRPLCPDRHALHCAPDGTVSVRPHRPPRERRGRDKKH
ncbi:hypothetical protein AAFF_G00265180 [Aldrovandia affinis]|uniref:BZIP domain-containing protein n=1 Tax=Aldrovandia affinis TaxID=143900 RepID=A0AAD7RC71_9TELE|nr:hypothetical protein AAFF_G00265180 [Aldrovandia affinis]